MTLSLANRGARPIDLVQCRITFLVPVVVVREEMLHNNAAAVVSTCPWPQLPEEFNQHHPISGYPSSPGHLQSPAVELQINTQIGMCGHISPILIATFHL